MPLRVLFAIDPGANGALAIFHNGELRRVTRLPKGGKGLDVERFGMMLRDELRETAGADVAAVLEDVRALPEVAGRKRGGATTGEFMRTVGKIEGVLACLRIRTTLVYSQKWKRHHGLDSDKDKSRALASRCWPWLDVSTKNSADLAEAALIGSWYLATVRL